MARTTKANPRARALGAELRQLREDAGFGVRELGRVLGVGHTTIWRYESGLKPPTPEEVASVLTALGVKGEDKERVIGGARAVRDPNWLTSGFPGVKGELAVMADFERTATAITEVQMHVVPGLFQTRDYMSSIMGPLPRATREARVAFRLSRREILDALNPPEYVVVLGEAALREVFGGPEVMGEQLRYLMKVAERPGVTVQVLPFGATDWHPAHAGSFMLFEFGDQDPIVHLEHYRTAAFLRNVKDVRDYQEAAIDLRRRAMSPAESRDFMGSRLQAIESELL
ncbi:XRE family transcriptional regulator [Saccharopolyspora karakumensis]|uniref:XRE family transcriptional regulator n=1 Tax=Saccharopolyspora karakumensis TaxID=2530386 RepID=A0A4R5C7Y3_9PSEU|nr:helix-turn-helix transcriptional regulator [Saccharopolyspora karakumensis]TDD93082.1 XRE family transcriptional regulator [Saccharopolyspora karakumensis]